MISKEIGLDDITFIIVLYKVRLYSSITISSLLNMELTGNKKINLIVYDNSPEKLEVTYMEKINLMSYVHDKTNPGVSKAYNYGADFAKRHGFKWVVLLDQDTNFQSNFISKIITAINKNPELNLFSPVLKLGDAKPFSPTRYMFKRGHAVELEEGILSLSKYSPVNSGMTINTDAFEEVGGYFEEISLDFADFQFIEKFRKKHEYFYLIDSVGIQDFSNNETDLKKLENRFVIFCQCARKCTRYSFGDSLGYFYTVLRHTIGLFLKTKSFKFFIIAYANYFK
jgi:rhamnosyltransferase